jgi:hypothetical protein
MVLFIKKGIEYWNVYRKCPNFIKKKTSLQMNELAFRIAKGMIIICV